MSTELRYRCPKCSKVGEWTNGTSTELGDDADEYWCQACGAQVPLYSCTPMTPAKEAGAQ